MARRSSFLATVAQMQREAARADAARRRSQAAAHRESVRAQAAYQRAVAADERERRRLYAEARLAEAEGLNQTLEDIHADLDSLLAESLDPAAAFQLDALKRPPILPTWQPDGLDQPEPPPDWLTFAPAARAGLSRVFSKSKQEQTLREAQSRYEQACREHGARDSQRVAALNAAWQRHNEDLERAQAQAQRENAQIDELSAAYTRGEANAVTEFFDLALQASNYPDGFPHEWRLAYLPDAQQLVIEYELPLIEVVPTVKTYRYVKSTDTIGQTARPAAQVKTQYGKVVAQVALRVAHELFAADHAARIQSLVFNGMVSTIDPATGQSIRPCLITMRPTRERFGELDLARVDPTACLKHLGAGVSRSAAELVPVRPILEFDMVDSRFITSSDILSEIDQRPNLLEMTPTEFETLIENLFSRMGLETRQTRASRDGGVDCVAYDQRPILGGKVVIQAKRYRHTVGIAAVRDLYGTVHNEGASKGILVTTSTYGQASYEFVNNKPLELIDGSNLLSLLRDHAGLEAKIIPPDDWQDPVPDQPDIPAFETDAVELAEPALAGTQPVVLSAGQNAAVTATSLRAEIAWNGQADIDLSFVLLAADGRVRSDADFVFYNQPRSPDGAIRFLGPMGRRGRADRGTTGELDLTGVDPAVTKIVIVASAYDTTLAAAEALSIAITGDTGPAWTFKPTVSSESALLCAEVYRRNGWRIRAVGQGYDDGLAGLARDFGVSAE